MKYTKLISEVNKDSLLTAGGKGASLGETLSHGFNVPPGFIVTAQTYEEFAAPVHNQIAAILKELDVEDTKALDEASKKIQRLILNKEMPPELKKEIITAYADLGEGFVACRSSATMEDLPSASFAGQQATFLNVHGNDKVIEAVQNCWASLFTSRAIYYRATHKFDHMKALIAVVVQRMVNSKTAGVSFSVNPIDNNRNELVIEASFGLGEAVVSGQVTPDLYIVRKEPFDITQKNVNEQTWGYFRDVETGETVKKDVPNPEEQVISDDEVMTVAELVLKAEKHYNHPQDIEWAIDEEGELFLLQSRPITTLNDVSRGHH